MAWSLSNAKIRVKEIGLDDWSVWGPLQFPFSTFFLTRKLGNWKVTSVHYWSRNGQWNQNYFGHHFHEWLNFSGFYRAYKNHWTRYNVGKRFIFGGTKVQTVWAEKFKFTRWCVVILESKIRQGEKLLKTINQPLKFENRYWNFKDCPIF